MDGDDLIMVDRDKPKGKMRGIFIGELDGRERPRTRRIKSFFAGAGIPASLEENIDGWLKYHFAFVAPVAAIVSRCGGVSAVAGDKSAILRFVRSCREAGNVLRKTGYPKRQPFIFNLFYWLPDWLVPKVFKPFFESRYVEVAMGLHARNIGDEFSEMMREFEVLRNQAGLHTPILDQLMAGASQEVQS